MLIYTSYSSRIWSQIKQIQGWDFCYEKGITGSRVGFGVRFFLYGFSDVWIFRSHDYPFSVAEQEVKQSMASLVFLSLVKTFNETHEKQISEKQAREYWKDNYAPHHRVMFDFYYNPSTVEDAIQCFNELREARNADDDVKVGILKNNRRESSAGYKMCSAEELKEELQIGRIAFVYFDKESMASQTGMSNEILSNFIYPIFGSSICQSISDATYAQSDFGVAVLGLRGDKVLVWSPKEEKEMDLETLVDISYYILVFESEKLKEKQQEEQEKSESEAYLEKIRQEVKK